MHPAHTLVRGAAVLLVMLAPAGALAQREVPVLRPAPTPPENVPAGWTAPATLSAATREALLAALREQRGTTVLPPRGGQRDVVGARERVQGGHVATPLAGPASWPLSVTPQNVTAQQPGQSASGARDRIRLSLVGAEYQGPNAIILRHSSSSLFGYQLTNAHAVLEVEVRTPGYYVISATGATQNSQIRLDVFSAQAAATPEPLPNPNTVWNTGQHTLQTWSGQTGVKHFPVLVELEAGTYWFYYIVRGGWLQLQQASIMPLEQG